MAYIICYDIEDDYIRQKTADKLLAAGLYRIQFSVFAGEMEEGVMQTLWEQLEKLFDKIIPDKDNILIFKISKTQLKAVRIIGNNQLNFDEMSGDLDTLII